MKNAGIALIIHYKYKIQNNLLKLINISLNKIQYIINFKCLTYFRFLFSYSDIS